MFQTRQDEPQYAKLPDVTPPQKNQWGDNIETVQDGNKHLAGDSLRINSDGSVPENPNRYKQHGFHFTADNCIGCHACEAACSEKNQLPAHISFRSVGFVEGGSYPAYQRLNISMACNHCDNPVCLKGCPTRAYTKFAEYGAVLQDPDICFGCGYCTWVCPYNAPQLDPIEGQVSKCNMCVDRLEVGLKPACTAACLGGALDFGIIETKPEHREQTKISIPGFPTPEITHPNIRFQQVRTMPRELTRPDTMPLRYRRDDNDNTYKAKPKMRNKPVQWNIKKLHSREDPLVIFTLVTQAVIGAWLSLTLAPFFGLHTLSLQSQPIIHTVTLTMLWVLQATALGLSTMHLGKPHRFYRAFNNLKFSPVSREVAAVAVFFAFLTVNMLSLTPLLTWLPTSWQTSLRYACGMLGGAAGIIAIYAMHRIYRIPARPFWNHWHVLTDFYGSMLILGPLLVLGITTTGRLVSGAPTPLGTVLSYPIMAGIIVMGIGLIAHARYLRRSGGEAEASMVVQTTDFGHTYTTRNLLLLGALMMLSGVVILQVSGVWSSALWIIASLALLTATVIWRALFYVLVIPTTMPGAFFWRNAGFQAHARESGLADMPQTGVLPHTEYHDLQLTRAKRDIKRIIRDMRSRGIRPSMHSAFRVLFSRS